MLIKIENYSGENIYVKRIMHLLIRYRDIFIGAYVFGSLATFENIKYSDFDGLLIVSDKARTEKKYKKKLVKFINKSLRIIYVFDPLQHHRWFLLKESDLENYPVTYFPPELFRYAKSLLADKGQTITIKYDEKSIDYKKPFFNLAAAIEKKIISKKPPKNVYYLKGLLSQFMLLPSLYCQARDSNVIYKKHSFDEARKNFTNDEWKIMDRVSEIRINWDYKMNIIQKFLLKRNNYLVRRIAINLAAKITGSIEINLDDLFYSRMLILINSMRNKNT